MPGTPPGFVVYPPADRRLFCWQAAAMNLASHRESTGGIGLPPESALTFTALTQVPTGGKSREAVVLPGFTTSEQQEKKQGFTGLPGGLQEQVLHLSPCLHVTCLLIWLSRAEDGYSLLRKAVSAETSFHPDIVYAVRETSLKYIGKGSLLFCQYKPCLHEGALPPLLQQSRSPADRLTYTQRNSPDFSGASMDLSWYKCEIDTGPPLVLWHLKGILKNHKNQCRKNRQKILTHPSLRPIKINNALKE